MEGKNPAGDTEKAYANLREYVLYLTHYGIDFNVVMAMPMNEFVKWHEAAAEFHDYRLKEQLDLLRDTRQTPHGGQTRNRDPLTDFL